MNNFPNVKITRNKQKLQWKKVGLTSSEDGLSSDLSRGGGLLDDLRHFQGFRAGKGEISSSHNRRRCLSENRVTTTLLYIVAPGPLGGRRGGGGGVEEIGRVKKERPW